MMPDQLPTLRETEKGLAMLVENMLPLAREKLVTLREDAPLIEAAKLLAHKEANLVVICRASRRLVGVVAKTDVVRLISGCRGASCKNSVASAMTRKVVTCRSADFLTDVWSRMKAHGLKHIPIVDSRLRPIGLAIARDVLGLLKEEVEQEEQLLRDYVMCVGFH
jgi:CBS domain-containing protein